LGSVHQLATRPDLPTLGPAAEAYLRQVRNPNTARSYAIALRALVTGLGSDTPIWSLDSDESADRLAEWFTTRWGAASTSTHNVRLDAIRSAANWWRDQGWITGNPARRVRRHKRPVDRARAIASHDLEALLSLPSLDIRDRTLWRMLYESAARAEEVLSLDVDRIDMPNRRAKVTRKGGANDVITWRTGTARLLPRMLDGRRTGPLFLTHRRARVELPPSDRDPGSGRARLSYRRAAEAFERATADMPEGPWTLHQLRHSALTHAAEDGANTATLLSFSGHSDVRSLARYARVSAEALSRWQNERDEARRGR
jgi:integrase